MAKLIKFPQRNRESNSEGNRSAYLPEHYFSTEVSFWCHCSIANS